MQIPRCCAPRNDKVEDGSPKRKCPATATQKCHPLGFTPGDTGHISQAISQRHWVFRGDARCPTVIQDRDPLPSTRHTPAGLVSVQQP